MPPPPILTPIGYTWLAEHFAVDPIPHFVESYLSEPGRRIREEVKGGRREIYPGKQYDPRTVFDHLEFALKREGLHLPLLRLILPRLAADEVAAYVRATPTGRGMRGASGTCMSSSPPASCPWRISPWGTMWTCWMRGCM